MVDNSKTRLALDHSIEFGCENVHSISVTSPLDGMIHDPASHATVPQGFHIHQTRRARDPKITLPREEDEGSEVGRHELQHHAYRYLLHGNFNAPVDDQLEEGIRVLDVGCGSGIWSVDMARDFPNSTFVGTDITPQFITSHSPNCRFVVANTLEGLPFEDNYFHYVFQRKMAVVFSVEDWAKAIQELIRVTKPGGYIELVEYNQAFYERGPAWAMFQDCMNKIIQSRGGYAVDVSNLPALLHELEDVEFDYASAPIGWHDRSGDLIRRAAELLIQNIRSTVQPELGFTDQQYDSMARDVHDEWAQHRTWKSLHYAYGRKKNGYTS